MAVSEGSAHLRVSQGVFFNAKQTLQRDLSVLAVQTYGALHGRPLRLLDALSGGGVRAIRYLLEVEHISAVAAKAGTEAGGASEDKVAAEAGEAAAVGVATVGSEGTGASTGAATSAQTMASPPRRSCQKDGQPVRPKQPARAPR